MVKMNFSHFAYFAFTLSISFLIIEAEVGGGYGGYTMKCPGNAPPLSGSNGQIMPCQNNQSCGSMSTHYCQSNPVRGQPGVCCPFCPNGGEPMTNPTSNQTQGCQSDQECGSATSSAYFCVSNPGAPKICCPRCLNAAEPMTTPGTKNPITCQQDSQCGGASDYFCVASNPLQTSNPAKVCCPLCPGGGKPKTGENSSPKSCDTPDCCGTDGAYFCSKNPIKGNPNLCCPACLTGGAPLQGPDTKPMPCDTDQCCNSPAHYCAKNPLKPKTNLCCPQCPCGSPPLMAQDNQLLPCQTDQCCTDPNYYCFVSNVTGKANVCCPRGPGDVAPQPDPQPEPQPASTSNPVPPTAEPQPATTPMPTTTTTPTPTTTTLSGSSPGAPAAQPTLPPPAAKTTMAQAYTTAPSAGSMGNADVVPPEGATRSAKTWPSMFNTYKKKNPTFAIPNADTFRTNSGSVVATSGQYKVCTKNADCYDSREPSEWCKSMPKFTWVGEGCICDLTAQKPSCVITREEVRTKRKEWSFCQLETEFQCR